MQREKRKRRKTEKKEEEETEKEEEKEICGLESETKNQRKPEKISFLSKLK